MRQSSSPNGLLAQSDPEPVRQTGAILSRRPFLLVGDHAGSAIPAALDGLGLAEADRQRHIAVDIGVEELGLALAERLGSPFLRQVYSRLVVDCNRDPAHPEAIAETSDGTRVPGNSALDEVARQARVETIFEPYHHAIAAALDTRAAAGLETILISLHSFTPDMNGSARPWHIGVLHDGHEDKFARCVLSLLQAHNPPGIGDNQPYAMDATDYTVPHHAFARGLRYAEIEVRQDLLGGEEDRTAQIANLLATTLIHCA